MKTRSRPHNLALVLKEITYKKSTLVGIVLIVFALQFLQLAPSILIGTIIDGLNDQLSQKELLSKISLYLAVSLLFLFMLPLQSLLLNRFVQHAVAEQSNHWLKKLIDKPFTFFRRHSDVYFYKTVERAMLALEQFLNLIFITIVPVAIETIIAIGYFALTGNAIFILLLCGVSLVQFVLILIMVRYRRNHIVALNDAEDNLADHTVALFKSALLIKLQRAVQNIPFLSKPLLDNYRQRATTVAVSASVMTALNFFLKNISIAITLIIGIVLVSADNSTLSVGELVINFSIITTLLVSIEKIALGYRLFDSIAVDMYNLQELIGYQSVEKPKHSFEHFDNIEIYKGSEKCYTIARGSKVLIVGASGTGKTTMIETALGMRDEGAYRFVINGVDLRDISESSVLDIVQYIPQTPNLFYGNLSQSIFYETTTNEAIDTAIRAMQVSPHIYQQGFTLDLENEQLSAGEKSRLHFSRFLACNRPIAILDEPTNALDEYTRDLIWQHIFSSHRTLLVISHDLSQTEKFDLVIKI